MDWDNIDSLVTRHMKALKKKSKFTYPEEIVSQQYFMLNSRNVKINWLEHGIRKKVERLKKRAIRYPFHNLSRIKI